ncbi:DNA polymerase III subunit delta' [Periweissella beninensis]|uniref:DNA polymerase III subunit delta n=1 Tax=Periweissella beninensis TaxID=504936 RepID=A0ABT0VGG8_9LACO|nr:DNA polymerase III subunit delta' [Periweissella beninensis]MBM7544639.1 DNA polymerase-3 subunit delta' [Periweissella beninensis]MCM2436918.1 DNA polymerase III subunit delta' [Periweissella beninensis]
MTPQEIFKHLDKHQIDITKHFERAIEHKRLAHAFIFDGPDMQQQELVATWLAMRLFCLNDTNKPCGECNNCQRIVNGEHPDVISIVSDNKTIKIDEIRYIKNEFNKRAVEGFQKFLIIKDADKLTVGAENSLLKFIEEPQGPTTIVLLTQNRYALLPTIISRTQLIEFKGVTPKILAKELTNLFPKQNVDIIKIVSHLATDLKTAEYIMADDWVLESTHAMLRWYTVLMKQDIAAFAMVQMGLGPLGENDRLKEQAILDLCLLAFRDVLRMYEQREVIFLQNIEQNESILKITSLEQILKIMDVILKAPQLLKQNINFQTIMEKITLEIWLILKG